jgi:radical SAM protein with 4Fe4S-binding SPASM domain
MSWSLFKKVIDELADYVNDSNHPYFPMQVCLNYGGESLLHPNAINMIQYASKQKCFWLRIITNGTLLTPEMIQTLVDSNVEVSISIHNNSQIKETYRKVTALACHAYYHNISVNGILVKSEFEVLELIEQLKLWTRLLDSIRVYPLETEDLKYVDFPRENKPKCIQPSYYMGILWNGDTYPCCELLSTDFKGMGNVAESSLMAIWNGESYLKLRDNKLADVPCLHCEFGD